MLVWFVMGQVNCGVLQSLEWNRKSISSVESLLPSQALGFGRYYMVLEKPVLPQPFLTLTLVLYEGVAHFCEIWRLSLLES